MRRNSCLILFLLSTGCYSPTTPQVVENPVVVRVTTNYPGAGLEVVEQTITVPLESALQGVTGVAKIRSWSNTGSSIIDLELDPTSDPETAARRTAEILSKTGGSLPAEASAPLVQRIRPYELPAQWLVLSSDTRNLTELGHLAREIIRPRLLTVAGVGNVLLLGDSKQELRIQLDTDRLSAWNLDAFDVLESLQGQDGPFARTPEGLLEVNPGRQTREELTDSLERHVMVSDGARIVRLRDLARVQSAVDKPTSLAQRKGKSVVAVAVMRQFDADLQSVTAATRQSLIQIAHELPQDVRLDVPFDLGVSEKGLDLLIELDVPPGLPETQQAEVLKKVEEGLRTLADTNGPMVDELLSIWQAEATNQRLDGIYLRKRADLSAASVGTAIRRKILTSHPGVRCRILGLGELRPPRCRRYPIELTVTGPELENLVRLVQQIEKRLEVDSLVTDLHSQAFEPHPAAVAVFDRERAAELGISSIRLVQVAAIAVGSMELATVIEGDHRTTIRLELPGHNRESNWKNVRLRTSGGQLVPLDSVLQMQQVTGPLFLYREGLQRAAIISCNPSDPGKLRDTRRQVLDAAEKVRSELVLPSDYGIR